MGTALKKAVKIAAKRSALSFATGENALIARKELKRMADRWERREPNPGKFHKPKGAMTGNDLRRNANRKHLVMSY